LRDRFSLFGHLEQEGLQPCLLGDVGCQGGAGGRFERAHGGQIGEQLQHILNK
jgi:hypothetical protein